MSPYSGGQSATSSKTGHRFAWARLNSDALLLVLLAIGSALFDIADPMSDTTIAEIGFPTASFYLRCATYLVGGLMLLSALIRQSVGTEVIARTVLTFGVGFECFRHVLLFGAGANQTLPQYVLVGIMLLTTGLRVSVLLSRKGLIVRLPERKEGQS